MHPEIRKFWEQAGYRIDYVDFSNMHLNIGAEDAQIYYTIHKSNDDVGRIVGCTLSNKTNLYWLGNKKYSENEMLKIIKLTAFL